MSFDLWLAFTFTSILLTLILGPSVLLVISQSITKGKKAALMCVAGDLVGTIILMGLSFLGVGAILATSAILFQAVKWAGVLYLAYLGFTQIRDTRQITDNFTNNHDASIGWDSFWAGTVTAVLNPKAIIFYMAFLAQFIDPAGAVLVQMTILTATSTLVVAVLLTGYALIASQAQQMFQSTLGRKRMGYASGTFMLGGSVLLASTR